MRKSTGIDSPTSLLKKNSLRLLSVLLLLAALIVSMKIMAHGGEDHGVSAGNVDSVSAGGGSVINAQGATLMTLPKESQFAFQVYTEPVMSRTLAKSRGVTGIVVAPTNAVAEVYAPQAGRITLTRPLKAGDRVTKGQALFSVTQVLTGSERLALERDLIEAKRELDESDRDYTRKKSLAGVVAQKEIELAGIRLKSAKERYVALQQAGTKGTLPIDFIAPISGVITDADLVTGEFVDVTKRILQITNLSTVWVEASLYQSDLKDLPPTRSALISVPSSNSTFVGTLVSSGSTVDPESKAIKMTFAVNNSSELLKIGASATVQLNIGPPAEVLAVAKEAVINNGGISYVFVHTQPEQFVAKEITLGSSMDERYIEVQSGLEANERAVVSGTTTLRGRLP